MLRVYLGGKMWVCHFMDGHLLDVGTCQHRCDRLVTSSTYATYGNSRCSGGSSKLHEGKFIVPEFCFCLSNAFKPDFCPQNYQISGIKYSLLDFKR